MSHRFVIDKRGVIARRQRDMYKSCCVILLAKAETDMPSNVASFVEGISAVFNQSKEETYEALRPWSTFFDTVAESLRNVVHDDEHFLRELDVRVSRVTDCLKMTSRIMNIDKTVDEALGEYEHSVYKCKRSKMTQRGTDAEILANSSCEDDE